MIKKLIQYAVLLIALSAAKAFAGEHACFTPGEDCTAMIVQAIDGARSELLVQAYGFTSEPIIQAVVNAKERGVMVKIILDKINEQERYTAATFLKNHGIEPLIDDKVAIAHNKVMVLDRRNVITGSFNFTKAAQQRNAESVHFVLDEPRTAAAYADNWQQRAEQSRPYRDFRIERSINAALTPPPKPSPLAPPEPLSSIVQEQAAKKAKSEEGAPKLGTSSSNTASTSGGCGSHGGPGYRLASGKCASWHHKRE
jgi:phosphatidylserine/phosphatidylglycerophosphate/cardiolipin synthase-like enzyme